MRWWKRAGYRAPFGVCGVGEAPGEAQVVSLPVMIIGVVPHLGGKLSCLPKSSRGTKRISLKPIMAISRVGSEIVNK